MCYISFEIQAHDDESFFDIVEVNDFWQVWGVPVDLCSMCYIS